MNKKLLLGLSLGVLSGAFWACGSGDIYKVNEGDSYMDDVVEDSPAFGVKTDLVATRCPECGVAESSSSSKVTPSATSSFVVPKYSSYTPTSMSSIVVNLSSSSGLGPVQPLSSAVAESSSSVVISGETAGTCAPDPATVNRGESVTWKFTRDPVIFPEPKDLIPCTFNWTFEGGSKPSVEIVGVTGPTIKDITYDKSGKHNTSLVVKNGSGKAYSVACSPVQVNGAPITGCKCALAADVVDVAVDGTATWTVTGCASTGANITSYTWTGATGEGATASTVLAKKGDIGAAKVAVGNDDNTIVEVECPSVKAIDGNLPDYIIEKNQLTGAIKIPAGLTSVKMDVAGLGGTSCTIFCQTDYTPELQGALTMKVGTQSAKGSFNVTVSLPLESCSGGKMLDFDLSAPATCGVQ